MENKKRNVCEIPGPRYRSPDCISPSCRSPYENPLNNPICEPSVADIYNIIITKKRSDEKMTNDNHYNKWLTDNIQNYLRNMDEEIKYLFEPYVDFSKMIIFLVLAKVILLTRE